MNKDIIKYNNDFIKKVKSYSLAIIFSMGMNEILNGLSDDILEPIINEIVSTVFTGKINDMTNVFGVRIYLRRFVVKAIIFLLLIMFTYYMLKS
mgnify:CR=1 FL=1